MIEGITVTGLDDCLKFFDNLPKNMVKVTRKALREGGNAVARQIRRRVPKRWSRLVRAKVTSRGRLYATVGMFNGHQAQGNQPKGDAKVDDWFKMYWLNYGTLEGRDPTHQFDNPIKPSWYAAAKRRRGQSGVRHRNFFEESIKGWRETFIAKFNESLARQERELYNR